MSKKTRRRRPEGTNKLGSVYLVGAGPGAADLLTLRAVETIRRADILLYDRLINLEVLDWASPTAQLIAVGKRAGRHSVAQAEINERLLAYARAGFCVVRLKGGDPLVFGRGGEEESFLRRHGIQAIIVPGITAALGCAASLGLPLTFRGVSQKVMFITGHSCDGKLDLKWTSLADSRTTFAIYMGRANVESISRQLIGAGLPASTPAVAIENGTCPEEKYWFTNLRLLPDTIARRASDGPLLVFIGAAVSLAQERVDAGRSEIHIAA